MQPATDALKDALRAGRPQIGLWSMLSGPVAAEVVFASKMGADPAKVRQALMGGFAASRVLEVHGERMIARTFEPGFRVELHQKDLNLALSNARQVGVSLPNTATAVETWDLTASPIDMLVGFSNEQDGRAAAEHLLARRRQRLALVMADDQRSLLRRQGFTAALREPRGRGRGDRARPLDARGGARRARAARRAGRGDRRCLLQLGSARAGRAVRGERPRDRRPGAARRRRLRGPLRVRPLLPLAHDGRGRRRSRRARGGPAHPRAPRAEGGEAEAGRARVDVGSRVIARESA